MVFAAVDPLGKRQLWIRRLDSLRPEPLPSTDDGDISVLVAGQPLDRILRGGPLEAAQSRCWLRLGAVRCPRGGRGGSWGPTTRSCSRLVCAADCSRSPLAAARRRPSPSIEGTPFTSHRWPQILPDGRHFLYLAVQQEDRARSERGLPRLARRAARRSCCFAPAARPSSPAGICCSCATRHSGRSHSIAATATLSGAPAAVARDVMQDPTIWRGIFDVNESGVLVYQTRPAGHALDDVRPAGPPGRDDR